MKIGIDARMFGPTVGGGGLGRYVEQLVTELQANDHKNRYVLFLKKENIHACKITNPNFEKRLADIHWYTLEEQLKFGRIVDRESLDLIHFPHWNVPIALKTPFIVTIHDLILLEEPRSSKVTTRNIFVFLLKYFGYKLVLSHAIRASKKIIAVSHATADVIQRFFPTISKDKISVQYEGVTPLPSLSQSFPVPVSPNLLYIGNAYPHKNLERLLEAFAIIRQTHPNTELILAGTESTFYKRLLAKSRDHVTFVPNPTDKKLTELLKQTTLFVFPSRIEGFGLPPLEAMHAGVPVAASDIPSLREILDDSAVFFPPNNPTEIARVITDILDHPTRRKELIAHGLEHIKRFSWKTMALNIASLYETCGKETP